MQQLSEELPSLTTLSICEPITALSSVGRDADWLRPVITGNQVPHFIVSQNPVADQWADIHARNVTEKLDPKTPVALFITPTGVLGYYNPNLVNVYTRDNMPWGRVTDPKVLPQGEEIAMPHLQLGVSLELSVYQNFLVAKGPNDFAFNAQERLYMRSGNVLPQVLQWMPPEIPTDAVTTGQVSFYVSHAGTTTNLHWDLYSGVIHQLKGRKRVIVFAPNQRPYFDMYPVRHIFSRRSRISEKLTEATLDKYPQLRQARGYECIIEPDQWLYIPAGWMHHVETLDDDTISLITRFTR